LGRSRRSHRHRIDITERTRTGEPNAGILESALDCIVTMDHQGLIIEFNPAAEKLSVTNGVKAVDKLCQN